MRFNYLEPATIEEAISLLGKYNGKAKLIAGGTDLYVQIRDKLIAPEYVIDMGYIPGLDYIDYDEKQGLRIGGLTTIGEIEKSETICGIHPVISQSAGLLGSVAIRNVATIGGNLANAAPSADTAPALIGLGAKAKIIGPGGERVVPLEDFFTGPGCIICEPGEILVEVQVPASSSGLRGAYLKHSRSSVDLATVGVAVITDLDNGNVCRDVKIVLGAVAPTPMRARKAEELLKGQKVEPALIEKTAEMAAAESRPITDVRASAEYRKEMVKVFTRRAIEQLVTK
jgi:carbon-monoxide dehydrogenase medium subunit